VNAGQTEEKGVEALNNQRFNKAALLEYLYEKAERLRVIHKLNPSDGWNQVAMSSLERNRGYGEYSVIREIIEAIESNYCFPSSSKGVEHE
jgi:hypothetical protein